MKIKQPSHRILIADDDPVVRHLVTSIVTKLGYTPVTLSDGRAAFSLLKTDADFKAAILDMSMPYLEGLDLIRYMRTEKRLMRIPVVLITSEQSIKLMAQSFAAGATAFLPKPFSPEQLQNLLRMLLAAKMPSTRAA
ncbi:MAG TPA: response regulator [Pyrinomonadaceae bacterium]|nr:response regulator [Pyrinomonadaceae bacterium]